MKLNFKSQKTIALFIFLYLVLPIQICAQQESDSLEEKESNYRDGKIETLDESKLPSPNEGYKWQILTEINAAFQMPVEWNYLNESEEDQFAYFMSKEDIEKEGSFKTGLSINVVKDVSAKIGKTAVQYARDIAIEIIRTSDTLMTGSTKISSLSQFLCRSRIKDEDGTSIIVHYLLIGNSATDTFYMIIFESPELEWEKSDKIAAVMLTNFALDDEI